MAHYQMPGCQLYQIHKTLAPDESKAFTNTSCTNNNLHQKENVSGSTWAPRAHMLDPDTKSLSPQFTPEWLNDSSIKQYSVKGLNDRVLGIQDQMFEHLMTLDGVTFSHPSHIFGIQVCCSSQLNLILVVVREDGGTVGGGTVKCRLSPKLVP
ncbi:hypothetical protein ARMGADRAFT_1035332 [Armillaria gallica]|uniref:Uncharacterized protein n=1 Tax=Armillaria gallica TaxID=47427 RepID=A0A2H3CUR7_ARMGA|nr:hypothetical protein ARMGADRAFT_1035332 [Armillaria gallica]